MKLASIFIAIISLVIISQGQLVNDYGTKQTDEARSFEAAQILVFGRWNDRQKEFLLNVIREPQSMKYAATEATEVFGKRASLFYSVGKRDITNFKLIWRLDSRADKVRAFDSLPRDKKAETRLINFAYRLATQAYRPDQVDFILEMSSVLPTATNEQLTAFETRTPALFTKDEWPALFGPIIGPYTGRPCTRSATGDFQGDCQCSIGSSFNMSCSDDCHDSGGACNATSSGCGFLGYFPCGGSCRANKDDFQVPQSIQ